LPEFQVRPLAAGELPSAVDRLSDLLIDAVDSGAGVSFMAPLAKSDAVAYWRGLTDALATSRMALLIAETNGIVAGTVQIHRVWPPNQPHRGEIAKLLVHRDYRGRGCGTALMNDAESTARSLGLTLLTFDSVAHGATERFYRNLGFSFVGIIPGYAYSGRSQLVDTAIFYKRL
jgi:GNAT superfamily N-acetyltransferase